MSTPRTRSEFAEMLISQDRPPANEMSHHCEELFAKIRYRMRLGKLMVIGAFLLVFLGAFVCYMLREYSSDSARALNWGALSLHILLWSIVYLLWGIHKQADVFGVRATSGRIGPLRHQDMFMLIIAGLLFVSGSLILARSFASTDVRRVIELTTAILWLPFFVAFFYVFRTAGVLAEVWLEYKKMELMRESIPHDGAPAADESTTWAGR